MKYRMYNLERNSSGFTSSSGLLYRTKEKNLPSAKKKKKKKEKEFGYRLLSKSKEKAGKHFKITA